MNTMPFTFGGNLVATNLDGEETEIEIAPEPYRALYEIDWRGHITSIRYERNDARPGRPDIWIQDASIPPQVKLEIMKQIEDEFRYEQHRIAQLNEEEAHA